MEKLYELNRLLAKFPKLGKLQAFLYPAICFGLLASGAVLVGIAENFEYIKTFLGF